MNLRSLLSFLLALAVLGAACGSDDSTDTDDSTTTSSEADGDTSDTSEGADNDSSDDDSDASDGGSNDGEPGDDSASGELPGDPFDIGPVAGEEMSVVGVAHDDELNFRVAPDPGSEIVTSVTPLRGSELITSKGEGRLLDPGAWWHVEVASEDAWANFAFLGALGPVSLKTDDVLGLVDADTETEFDSIEDFSEQLRAAQEELNGGPEPTLTFVTSPVPGEETDPEGGETVIDILGYGDDALRGERFLIQYEWNGSGITVSAIEVNPICQRGVSGGRCL